MKYQHISRLQQAYTKRLAVRDKQLELGKRTLIMGILNVTPDSFSDGGRFNRLDDALARAKQMIANGADLIDIGGESTRPGYEPVPLEEELARVIPVVELLAKETNVPLSVDTQKAEVAKRALEAGAHMINDIWGLKKDPDMAAVVAHYEAPIIIMHNREDMNYTHFVKDVIADLQESIRIAHSAGVKDEHIWLDPGIGFAKTTAHNLMMMNHLSEIVNLGYPVLLGTSRKSMIWKTLQLKPTEVIEGTAASVALGIAQGCQMIRVHDVSEMKKVTQFTDALLSANERRNENG